MVSAAGTTGSCTAEVVVEVVDPSGRITRTENYQIKGKIYHRLEIVSFMPIDMDGLNPLDARSRYTDFAQTFLRRQKSVYRLCFLMHTGTGMPESYRYRQDGS